MGKRELVALLNLSSWCLVKVERLFLAVPRGCLQFVIVVFPDHTHYFCFSKSKIRYSSLCLHTTKHPCIYNVKTASILMQTDMPFISTDKSGYTVKIFKFMLLVVLIGHISIHIQQQQFEINNYDKISIHFYLYRSNINSCHQNVTI